MRGAHGSLRAGRGGAGGSVQEVLPAAWLRRKEIRCISADPLVPTGAAVSEPSRLLLPPTQPAPATTQCDIPKAVCGAKAGRGSLGTVGPWGGLSSLAEVTAGALDDARGRLGAGKIGALMNR